MKGKGPFITIDKEDFEILLRDAGIEIREFEKPRIFHDGHYLLDLPGKYTHWFFWVK